MVRSGIIGTGFMGVVHARAVRAAEGEVRAVVGSSPEAGAAAVDRLGAQRCYPSAAELIDDPQIDVVHICTPNHLHTPLAQAALAAGKHVICEKPLATDPVEAAGLADAARTAGVVSAVPFVFRFYPTVREARARVRRGDAGQLRLLHGSYLQDWLTGTEATNWRVDAALGGSSRVFADIGVHWCDLVEFVTGHRISRLSARLLTAHSQRAGGVPVSTEDAVTVIFETDLGAVGSMVASQITHGRKNRLWFSLDGDDASLSFDHENADSLWIGGPEANTIVPRGSTATSAEAQRYDVVPAGHPQGYQDCFNAFVADVYAAVNGETPSGLPTFDDGRRAATITAGVLKSAATDSWVEVLP